MVGLSIKLDLVQSYIEPTLNNPMVANKTKNVLVIDDCRDNLLLMELLLQSEGYGVNLASSGMQGLAEIKKSAPDLVVLDLMMPDLSGLEVIQRLKESRRLSSIPTLLLTANANLERQDALNADEVCYKPFNIGNILNKISSLLSQR